MEQARSKTNDSNTKRHSHDNARTKQDIDPVSARRITAVDWLRHACCSHVTLIIDC